VPCPFLNDLLTADEISFQPPFMIREITPGCGGRAYLRVKIDFLLELLHTHLGFLFPKVFPCLLVIISHYPVSYILGENIPPGEYSLSVDTSV
jgi:hypothetical protein